jgi:ribose/xylose/arabinose/galactoside ABC-type transport system permease subunit
MMEKTKWFDRFKRQPEYMGVILLTAVIHLTLSHRVQAFLRRPSLQTLLSTNTPLIILTMAQCIVLISGNIDISTVITMTLVNVFAVMMPTKVSWMPVWAAYVIAFVLRFGWILRWCTGGIFSNSQCSQLMECLFLYPEPAFLSAIAAG